MLLQRSSALHYLTPALLLQLWAIQCLAQTQSAPTNSTTDGDEDEPTTVLTTGAIAGIAVGGAIVVLALLFLCFVCLYCCIRRRRRRGFTPTDKISATQVSNTLMYNAVPNELNGFNHQPPGKAEDEKFEMKLNMADDSVNPAMSTSLLRESTETRIPAAVLPSTLSPANALSLGTSDKGYIKMAAAGSVRPSKSADNLADSRPTEESDWGIYLNPDTVTVSAGIAAKTNNKPSKSSTKPAVSPKPSPAKQAPSPADEEPQDDVYVETNVFIEDRQQQESDNYYNSDTIETIRKGRSLIDVVDPVQTHAVYANIDGPPTPEHALKKMEEKEDYESIDQFLGNSPNSGTSPPKPESAEYYNCRPSTDRAEEDDYNYVEVTKPLNVENPYLLEDNQYIDMQRDSGTTPTPEHKATPTSKANINGPHKYINLDYIEDSLPKVDSASGNSRKKPEVMSELHFPPKTTSTSSEKDKQLYMNLLHEDGGEELYEELT